MGKPFIKLLLGAFAGLVIWMVMEPSAPRTFSDPAWDVWSGKILELLGISIGLVIAGYNGWLQGSKLHIIRGVLLGGFLGWIGARMGAALGDAIIVHTVGESVFGPNGSIGLKILAHIVALTPIGTFLGAAVGASSLNWRRAVQGAIGGTIGAGIGAALFDPIAFVFAAAIISARGATSGEAEVGMYSRALYCVLLGAGIGFFVGIIENLARVAWLRLALGRNEGKEWIVDQATTIIGRSETAQVPLFGDPAIVPSHASITRHGQEYYLNDLGSPTGTYLNGQRITQVPLFHGAVIQVGSYHLEFLMKVGASPQSAAEMLRAQQHYALQAQGAVAPYGVPAAAYGYPGAGMPAQQPYPAAPQQGMPGQQPLYQPQPVQPMPQPGAQTIYTPPTSSPTVVQPAQMAAPQLAVVAGPLTGQRFPITGNLEVGREGAGIPLSFDSGASRKHATFMASPGGIILTDLGSTNGTFVNEQRVQAATLVKGDLVRIGVTTFRVE